VKAVPASNSAPLFIVTGSLKRRGVSRGQAAEEQRDEGRQAVSDKPPKSNANA